MNHWLHEMGVEADMGDQLHSPERVPQTDGNLHVPVVISIVWERARR